MSYPSELRFFGAGVNDLITQDKKFITLRSEPKNFPPLVPVIGQISDQPDSLAVQTPLLILNEFVQSFDTVHPGVLLLDGYLSLGAAIDDIRQIYPNKAWNEGSFVASTFFMTKKQSNNFNESDLYILSRKDQEAGFQSDYMATLVYPAFFYWLIKHHGIPEKEYAQQLYKRGIIDDQRAADTQEYYRKFKRSRSEKTKAWNHWRFTTAG